jgi:hypoxanthine-guanine phosphoribosyltransferase
VPGTEDLKIYEVHSHLQAAHNVTQENKQWEWIRVYIVMGIIMKENIKVQFGWVNFECPNEYVEYVFGYGSLV